MGETTLTGIPLIMSYIQAVFNGVMEMVTDVIAVVIGNPLILFFVLLGVVGIAVGMLGRLLNLR